MSKLNETDIQGFVLRGYNFPYARYLFLELAAPQVVAGGTKYPSREFLDQLLPMITTGEHWDDGKPLFTVNIAFTHKGLTEMHLPKASLLSFPVEFLQGMKARGDVLCDTGRNASDKWDDIWRDNRVHVWLAVNAQTEQAREECSNTLHALMDSTAGARILGWQDASALKINGEWTSKEHFGYSDGFGNPDYIGFERTSQPGQGKLMKDGSWAPLATGELLLGYADEAGELPVAPIPHLLANNGTFMVYRKLHQNVATFRAYLEKTAQAYAGDRPVAEAKEKVAAKMVGRWRDGTPIELSPDKPNQTIARDREHNVNFTFGGDATGSRCPIGAHIRRANPRDAFGFDSRLINRRRITRRGLPYGSWLPEDQTAQDSDERGVAFMVLNASLARQFEFVQQQWIEYGNDSKLGNEKDPLLGNRKDGGRFMIQGDGTAENPPFMCGGMPNFVELRGGDYFFVPSMTALKMMSTGTVDPR